MPDAKTLNAADKKSKAAKQTGATASIAVARAITTAAASCRAHVSASSPAADFSRCAHTRSVKISKEVFLSFQLDDTERVDASAPSNSHALCSSLSLSTLLPVELPPSVEVAGAPLLLS